jgi:N-acetylglutamate synthase-like GNAT family acetyltransferase
MRVERVLGEAVVPLRHRVLRAGMAVEAARFDGDDEPTTRHFAAFDEAGAIVGCITMMRRDLAGVPAWQVRGMAVEPRLQSQGVGGRLLRHAEACADAAGVSRMWCNARSAAVAFYERQGWQVVSDEFEIPTAGPHRRMVRPVEASIGPLPVSERSDAAPPGG